MLILKQHLKKCWTDIREYLECIMTRLKLQSAEIVAGILSNIVLLIVVFFALLFCVFFVSVGLAIWLNNVLGSSFTGFLVVGGGYAIVFMMLYLLRKKLFRMLKSTYILPRLLKLIEHSL